MLSLKTDTDLLSLKIDTNVQRTVRNKQKTFYGHFESQCKKEQDPDLYQNVTVEVVDLLIEQGYPLSIRNRDGGSHLSTLSSTMFRVAVLQSKALFPEVFQIWIHIYVFGPLGFRFGTVISCTDPYVDLFCGFSMSCYL
jgi:hypothetical protein